MRAVAFDAMGVLYSPSDDLADGLIPFALAHGSPLSREQIAAAYRRAMVGEMSAREVWMELGVRGDPAELEARYLDRYELMPGMIGLLDELASRGVVLGCISNDIAEWSRARRIRHGLDRRIAHWTVSGEVGARKPEERIYRAFLESSGFAPEEVVIVDDRAKNVDAAAALGLQTILVDFGAAGGGRGVRTVDELRIALSALSGG